MQSSFIKLGVSDSHFCCYKEMSIICLFHYCDVIIQYIGKLCRLGSFRIIQQNRIFTT